MSQSRRNSPLFIATVLLVLQAALFYSASRGEAMTPANPLIGFPHTLGQFGMVQEGVVDKETLEVLKADDTLTRMYSNGQGVANLFIAFFKTQRTGQSPHSPKNCLPGSGWQPLDSGRIDVDTPQGRININRYLVSNGENESLVLYWYQSQGQVIAGEFAAKFWLITNSIRKHRSDTSLVRVVVPVQRGEEEKADAFGTAFVQAAYPAVKAYLPQ